MISRKRTSATYGLAWTAAALALLALAGCGAPAEPTAAAERAGETKTVAPPEKLIFAFQRQKDPAALKEDAEAVAKLLTDELGVPVEVLVPTSYGATVQALISNRADVAYLSSLPYLLAKKETNVDILLVEERAGKADYDSVLVVANDSPIQSVADLKGKRMAFTSPTSASGYVFPWAFFIGEGLAEKGSKPDTFFSRTQFAGGYDRALRAVVNGQADVAAVSDYTMEGPTVDKYITAEERAKLRILTRIPGVPTHLIAIRSDLPADWRTKIQTALTKLDPERLKDVYGAPKLVVPADNHVASAETALANTGLSQDQVVEK